MEVDHQGQQVDFVQVDTSEFLLPQRRHRVYIWAVRHFEGDYSHQEQWRTTIRFSISCTAASFSDVHLIGPFITTTSMIHALCCGECLR
jgi:site-specific DNA-cytosine methylase